MSNGSASKLPPSLYAKLSALMVILVLVVGFHFAVRGLQRYPQATDWQVPVADAERGHALIRHYGCGACHTIPGVRDATGKVGPRLNQMRDQMYIAGVLPNSPQNLTFWIQDPQAADPLTAMPDLGVGEQEARDMAAYLYSIR